MYQKFKKFDNEYEGVEKRIKFEMKKLKKKLQPIKKKAKKKKANSNK